MTDIAAIKARADLTKLAEAAIAARELASDCLSIEYHDYSNKAHDAHMAFINKIQPDDWLSLVSALPTPEGET
jgi:hypothetical protein